MNQGEILALYRQRSGDTAVPPLVSDEQAIGFLNEGLNEGADRARYLRDYTGELCTLNVLAGQRAYVLDPRILEVIMVRWPNVTSPLDLENGEVLLQRAASSGIPYRFGMLQEGAQTEQRGLTLVFDRTPAANATVSLGIIRLPMEPLEVGDDDAVPECPQQYHEKLVAWMLKRHFGTRDSDVGQDSLSARYDAEFTATFGPPRNALVERKRLRHRATVCRPIAF